MGASAALAEPSDEGVTIRVAAWHLPGIRTAELVAGETPRVRQIAQVIQRIRPNVVVLSGLAYDAEGGPGVPKEGQAGSNAARLVEGYLAKPQATDLQPLSFTASMPPTNSGMPSGMDLDRSGKVVTEFSLSAEAANPAFSGDAWGPGAYPGQFGLAILVDPRLTLGKDVRTFRLMPWDYMPSASLPPAPEGQTGKGGWFTPEQLKTVRLAATTTIDAPITLPNGRVVHVVSSNPSVLGGTDQQQRRARRHRDEIRFLADYVEGLGYIVDDSGVGGGLSTDATFVIMGQFNASPEDERSLGDPIASVLFSTTRLNVGVTPLGEGDGPRDATSRDGRRTTYMLPSANIGIVAAGVWRVPPVDEQGRAMAFPSADFPVWMDLWVRNPAGPKNTP